MAGNQAAIRLGVEGDAEVKRSFEEVGEAGERAAQKLGEKFQRESEAAEAAAQKAARTAARIAELTNVTPTQQRVAQVTGMDRDVGAGRSVRQAAADFQAAERASAAYQARAQALLASIDPMFAAQQRMNRGLAEAKQLLAAGALTTQQFAAVQDRLQAEYAQTAAAGRQLNDTNRLAGAGYQQLGFQANDVVAQLSSGSSPAQVFAQQASQIVQALQMIVEGKAQAARDKGGDDAGASKVEELGSAYEDAAGKVESLTGLLGGQAVAEQTSTGATTANTAATGANSAATGANTAATGSNTVAMEANALATTGAAAAKARFIAFLGGPWGAAVIAGVTVLASLGAALFKTEQSVDSLLKKKKEDFAESLKQQQADKLFEKSIQGRIEAIQKLIDANEDVGKSAEGLRAEASQMVAMFGQDSKKIEDTLREMSMLAGRIEDADIQGLSTSEVQPLIDRLNTLDDSLVKMGLTLKDRVGPELLQTADFIRRLREESEATDRALRRMEQATQILQNIEAEGDPAAIERLRYERRTKELNDAYTRGDMEFDGGGGAELERLQRENHQIHEQRMKQIEDQRRAQQEAAREAERLHEEARRRAKERAQFIASMEREAQAAYELAAAYFSGGDKLAFAEARHQALNDARQHGIDLNEQAGRQFSLNVAQQVMRSAQALAELRDETENIDFALANTKGGWRDLELAIERANQLGPLLRLEWAAEGQDLAVLKKAIDAVSQAYDSNAVAKARAALAVASGRVGDEIDDARRLIPFEGDAAEMNVQRALAAADREILTNKWTGDEAGEYRELRRRQAVEQNEAAERQRDREAQARLKDLIEERHASIAALELEHDMLGASGRERVKQLRLLEAGIELNAQFGGKYAEQQAALLALIALEEDRKIALERAQDAMAELEDIGGRLIDEFFDPANWENWGEAGQRILQELMQDLLRLAAINPLKNMLFGGDLPELGGLLGKLFGMGASAAGGAVIPGTYVGIGGVGYAVGTHHFPGGMALVGENGPELVRMPRGSQVSTAAETRRLMGANDNRLPPVSIVNHNDYRGAAPEAVAAIEAKQREQEERMYANVVGIVQDARERMMIR